MLCKHAVYLALHRYSKLMGDEPDLDPDINKDFFENNVLQLDPSLLTENGMKCFERFFKAVNCREGKLVAKRRAYMMDDLELIGLDYLWRVRRIAATCSNKQIYSIEKGRPQKMHFSCFTDSFFFIFYIVYLPSGIAYITSN